MNHFGFFILHHIVNLSPILDSFIVFCARHLPWISFIFMFAYLLAHYEGEFDFRDPFKLIRLKLREIIFVIITSISSWTIFEIMKNSIEFPRPFVIFDIQPLFVTNGLFDSFPSGHAMFFATLATSIYFINRRVGLIYFIIAGFIGLARVIAGVHFPLDIFWGYILGIFVSIIFRLIIKKI